MRWIRSSALFLFVTVAGILAGCGSQTERVLLPQRSEIAPLAARDAGTAGEVGPRICFYNSSFEFCYPSGGYSDTPEAEVPLDVEAGHTVTINWRADPNPGSNLRASRWTLDIADLFDETPRIDEQTDLDHWSIWSATNHSATVGPFGVGETHRFYVDVGDDQGLRSLGIVRIHVIEATNAAPVVANAAATPAMLWPPDWRFVPVQIGGVTDPDGDPVTIRVTGVTQDEPTGRAGTSVDFAPGGTDLEGERARWRLCPDAVILPDGGVKLRAERMLLGNGRVYEISFTASDPSGASSEGKVRVCVPRGWFRRECADDGQLYNSLECPSDGRSGSERIATTLR